MAIKVGDGLPEATFRVVGPDGIKTLTTKEVFGGKRVVLFAVPGAFTPTCHLKHLPVTKKIGMDFDGSGFGLGMRSKRYAAFVEDRVVKLLNVEDSPAVADASTAAKILESL